MARKHAHTTEFIVKTEDYFTAHLDDGGVRIGFVGGTCFDFPAGHPRHAEIQRMNVAAVETTHDELMGAYLATA